MGDFNAWTSSFETVLYDTSEEMLRELDVGELGLERHSHDREYTKYGRYLIEMMTKHSLAILNGLEMFLAFVGFTC